MSIWAIILIVIVVLVVLPVLAFLVMKFGTAGYLKARRRQNKEADPFGIGITRSNKDKS